MSNHSQPSLLSLLTRLGFLHEEAQTLVVDVKLTRSNHLPAFRAAAFWLSTWVGELNESEYAPDLIHALLDRAGMQDGQRFNNLLELTGCTPLELNGISFESFATCARYWLNKLEKAQASRLVAEEV